MVSPSPEGKVMVCWAAAFMDAASTNNPINLFIYLNVINPTEWRNVSFLTPALCACFLQFLPVQEIIMIAAVHFIAHGFVDIDHGKIGAETFRFYVSDMRIFIQEFFQHFRFHPFRKPLSPPWKHHPGDALVGCR